MELGNFFSGFPTFPPLPPNGRLSAVARQTVRRYREFVETRPDSINIFASGLQADSINIFASGLQLKFGPYFSIGLDLKCCISTSKIKSGKIYMMKNKCNVANKFGHTAYL
jgi:hypothetical protein